MAGAAGLRIDLVFDEVALFFFINEGFGAGEGGGRLEAACGVGVAFPFDAEGAGGEGTEVLVVAMCLPLWKGVLEVVWVGTGGCMGRTSGGLLGLAGAVTGGFFWTDEVFWGCLTVSGFWARLTGAVFWDCLTDGDFCGRLAEAVGCSRVAGRSEWEAASGLVAEGTERLGFPRLELRVCRMEVSSVDG